MSETKTCSRSTVKQLEQSLGETSKTRELLERLQQAYESEKTETLAKEKREELRVVADRGRLILIRGRFDLATTDDGSGPAVLEMISLEVVSRRPPPMMSPMMLAEYEEYPDFYHQRMALQGVEGRERAEIPMPPGVGVRVRLADTKALTASGREVFERGQPFFARAIAHTPTFDAATGSLSCVAYAVWGVPTP